MKKKDISGILLTGCVGVAILALLFTATFFPRIILPRINAVSVLALSLIALVIEFYLPCEKRRDYRLIPLYAALSFGLLPLAAQIISPIDALKTALLGAVVFMITTFLFDSLTDRLSSGPIARVAPAVGAVGIFLAAQALMGIV